MQSSLHPHISGPFGSDVRRQQTAGFSADGSLAAHYKHASCTACLRWLCCGYDNAFNNMLFSLGLYFPRKQSERVIFFPPLLLPGKCRVVFTAKQNSPFPDKLLSARGNALIFSFSSAAREDSDKKKKKKNLKPERQKRINAQVGYLTGRIHLE